MTVLEFELPPALEAHEPPEARGVRRDHVRLLAGFGRTTKQLEHHAFDEFPELLESGDVLVINRSATLPAAVDLNRSGLTVHFSTMTPAGDWLVEFRQSFRPAPSFGSQGDRVALPGGGSLVLLRRHASGRLWHVATDVPDIPAYLARFGRPIRYDYVGQKWPIGAYQTTFASVPGSAEMPSAGRPFTPEVVTRLIARGVVVVPITLHCGVASPELHEPPYAEWFDVPEATAHVVNDAIARGARIIAVGSTVVRALESAVGTTSSTPVTSLGSSPGSGPAQVVAGSGWTEHVVTPETGVRIVSGLLTGFHEPRASHLQMLEAIAGPDLVRACYDAALQEGYLWHEFGDVNLLLP